MTDLVTTAQKTKLRASNQAAQVFAIIDAPPTIYSCRVNQTFATHDMVAQFAFDGGSGTLANVLPDMTVLVGSAAGLADVGMCRVRKTWAAALAYIGEGSEIDWANDLYITVIDDFGIWARHIHPVAGVFYADYDVAYSDQHTTRDPLVLLGGDRVVRLTGASVSVAFSASNGLGGTTTWAWTATGATITGPATATPSIAFATAGRYRVTATATSGGKSWARHVFVHVLGTGYEPLLDFTLNNVDSDSGSIANITVYSSTSAIRDMARVIIFERAWYQGTEGSIGVVTGTENIVTTGFIAGESIDYDPDAGSVSFDVENAFYWLDRLAQYPSGIENTVGTASAWTNINSLTPDKAIWHLAHWRSTLSRIMDVVLSGDARQCAKLAEGTGSLGGQIRSGAAAILAEIAVDRYGRLHVQIPHNLIPAADRVTPTVMTLTDADIQKGIKSRRSTASQTAQVDLSGVAYAGGIGSAYFSLSPGHVFNRFGGVARVERIALTNQAQANELAGLRAGRENNKTPEITITLAGINRAFDTAPQGLAALSISAAHSPRGIGFTGNAVARRISYQHDTLTGRMVTQITFEPETFAALSTDGDPPADAEYPPDSPFPTMPPMPELPPAPVVPPIEPIGPVRAVVLHCYGGVFVTYDIASVSPTWRSMCDTMAAEDSLFPQMIIQMSAHRSGNGIVAVTTQNAYYASVVNSDTPSQFYKILTYAQLETWCPRGTAAGGSSAPTYYGCTADPLSGAMFVCGGDNLKYTFTAVPAQQPETILVYSPDYGSSWEMKRPTSPPGTFPPGETDRFWGFAFLRNITSADGTYNAQSSETGNNETSSKHFLNPGDPVLYRTYYPTDGFSLGNHLHHRVGYSKNLIYFRVPTSGSVARKFILETFGGSPAWGTTDVPVADISVSGAENVRARNFRDMLGIDPLGTNCLIACYDGYFWRSLDGGDNWAQDVAITQEGTSPNYYGDGMGRNPCLASPEPGVWLAAANYINWMPPGASSEIKRGKIMMSSDDGVTWADKTGNLYDIGAADIVVSSSNVGLSAYKIDFFYGEPES